MTVVAEGDEQSLDQIRKQLAKLIDVVDIMTLEPDASVCRELILIKVRVADDERQNVITMANVFRGRTVDVGSDSLIIELTGQQSKLGTLFSLTTSDYETPSKNIAIYGHHLSNSTAMFSTLLQYKDESYWKNHQVIYLNTVYGKRTYRIFAVLNHTVSDWDASTASFKNDEAFLKFVNRAQRKSFYDTGITVSKEDHIITLITCDRSYGGVQGRLLVMGVELREE